MVSSVILPGRPSSIGVDVDLTGLSATLTSVTSSRWNKSRSRFSSVSASLNTRLSTSASAMSACS